MPWLQIRAGSASSRRKKESSLRCKMSIFSLVKAARPNSSQRTRLAECRCWSSTTGHVSLSRSRSAAIWRGFIPSLTSSGAIYANKRRPRCGTGGWNWSCSRQSGARFKIRTRSLKVVTSNSRTTAKRSVGVVHQRLERMDRELNGHQFVAGDRFTIADITALVAIDIGGRLADIQIAPALAHLTRWHETVSNRASAKARGHEQAI